MLFFLFLFKFYYCSSHFHTQLCSSVCDCVCMMCLTSSTLDGAVLPAAMCPDVEILWLLLLLTAPVLGRVQGHGVLIVDFIALVMKQQHLDHNEEEVQEREAAPAQRLLYICKTSYILVQLVLLLNIINFNSVKTFIQPLHSSARGPICLTIPNALWIHFYAWSGPTINNVSI